MNNMERHSRRASLEQDSSDYLEPSNSKHTNASSSSQSVNLDEINYLLHLLPPALSEDIGASKSEDTNAQSLSDEVDVLIQDLNHAIDATISEIKNWDVEKNA